MSSYPSPERQFIASNLSADSSSGNTSQKRAKSNPNAKRGRKAKNPTASTPIETSAPQTLQWTQPAMPTASTSQTTISMGSQPPGSIAEGASNQNLAPQSPIASQSITAGSTGADGSGFSGVVLPVGAGAAGGVQRLGTAGPGGDEEGEGEDEILPAMADDDYSAQLSWQSQSKDNLKCVPYSLFSCLPLTLRSFQGADGQFHTGAIREVRSV